MNIWDKNALGPPLAKERDRNFPADIPLAPLAAPVDYWDDSLDNITPEPSNNWGRSAWDICVLNDLPLPGVCRVEPRARKRFDIKKNKGTQYATLTFTGEDPAEVLIIERIWTRGQLAQLQSQLIYLKSKQQGTTRDSLLAVQIAHPSCTLLQIHAVVIQGIDGLRPVEMWRPTGVFEQRIHCIEYQPISKKTVTKTVTGARLGNLGGQAINPAFQMPGQDSQFTSPQGR